jgi:mRNA-degrading endonuclease RelE of RelBE toxin-antitoxin system
MALMPNDPPVYQVEASDNFQRNLRSLSKRYRRIRSDIQPIIDQLQAGELSGAQIPNIGYEVFKVRVKNSDAQKGKSGGYRIIYYLRSSTYILLIALYSKADQGDVSVAEIQSVITEFEQQRESNE